MAMGVLALLGSGEIAPSMTKVHRRLLKHLDGVRAVSLNTPYGFQANVPQMTDKIVEYFHTSLNVAIAPLNLTNFDRATELEREIFRQEVRDANYIFAGPGSPSYAVKQWEPLHLAEDLTRALQTGSVVCFASAAALTLGAFTVPVYEIYKAGEAPFWMEGLDVLATAGLQAAIVPHFNNAEGGNYDTRFCYMGRERLEYLESLLPDGTGVLGVDEHTAAIIDLEARSIEVMGKGSAFWRGGDHTLELAAGTSTPLDQLQSGGSKSSITLANPIDSVDELEQLAAAALSGGDAAVAAVAKLARLASTGTHNYVDPTPLVEGMLALRRTVRDARDYALADQIRDVLVASGIDVQDGPNGVEWSVR